MEEAACDDQTDQLEDVVDGDRTVDYTEDTVHVDQAEDSSDVVVVQTVVDVVDILH